MNLDLNKQNLVFPINTNKSGTTGILIIAINNIRKVLESKKYCNNFDEINIFLKFKGFNKKLSRYDVNKSSEEIELFNNKSFQDLFIDIPREHKIFDLIDNSLEINKILSNVNNYKIAKKLNWNNNIINKINHYKDIFIDNNTLGVHLRFTSMSMHNDIYGNVTINDYIKKIKIYIEKYNIKNLFIAADNIESIKIIKDVFSNIKINYFENFSRQTTSNDSSCQFEIINRSSNKESYTEVILESIMLSKCKYIIYRVSSVSLLAILLSDNIISECLNNNKNFL